MPPVAQPRRRRTCAPSPSPAAPEPHHRCRARAGGSPAYRRPRATAAQKLLPRRLKASPSPDLPTGPPHLLVAGLPQASPPLPCNVGEAPGLRLPYFLAPLSSLSPRPPRPRWGPATPAVTAPRRAPLLLAAATASAVALLDLVPSPPLVGAAAPCQPGSRAVPFTAPDPHTTTPPLRSPASRRAPAPSLADHNARSVAHPGSPVNPLAHTRYGPLAYDMWGRALER